ncbi:MAG: Gfo/Idh/MocA family oxidoreductase [Acidimicrobiales bacterium]|nr:Gfo/Idh/MocA family oxidoreductase [Acidimicrobiales bacterium]
MRCGIIGCGYWGSKHVRVLAGIPGVEVVAIDSSPQRRAAIETTFGQVVTTADRFSDVASSLDAVVIATPPETHFALAAEAILGGLHVLVEKPLTTSSSDARKLIDMAGSAGVTLMTGHTFMYNPAVEKLRDIVQSGELGTVYHIDTARLNLGLYQQNVDVIWDLAPHDISILNYVLGEAPTTVRAWGGRYAHRTRHDVAYLQLDYRHVGAQVHVSWLEPRKVRRVTVVGSAKMAVYNDLADDERLRIYDKGVVAQDTEQLHSVPTSYRNGGIMSPFVPFEEPLLREDRDFIHCISTGDAPVADGTSGLSVVRVLEAASEALSTGGTVEFDLGSDVTGRIA